jgi:hypothetical protein
VGAIASTLCAIHCVICAFLPFAFAFLGMDVLMGDQFEWGLTIFAIIFAFFALYLGWHTHRTPYILLLLVVGIIGLSIARGLEGEHSHSEELASVHASQNPSDHHEEVHSKEHASAHDHADSNHDDHADSNHDDHADSNQTGHADHHNEGSHLLVEGLAIFSSFCLLIGHLLNLVGINRAKRLNSTHECTPTF